MECGVGEAVAFNSFIYVLNIGHFSINGIFWFLVYMSSNKSCFCPHKLPTISESKPLARMKQVFAPCRCLPEGPAVCVGFMCCTVQLFL